MEKVIEILKKHNFENIVIKSSRIIKLKESDKSDEEILEETAIDYIKFLVARNKLTDEEDDIIINASQRLLAKEALILALKLMNQMMKKK